MTTNKRVLIQNQILVDRQIQIWHFSTQIRFLFLPSFLHRRPLSGCWQLRLHNVVNKAVKAINLSLAKTHPDKNQCVLYNVLGEKDKQVFQTENEDRKHQRGFHFFSCCNHFLVYCQLRSIVLKYSVNSLSGPAVWAPASVFHPHSWRNNPRACSD